MGVSLRQRHVEGATTSTGGRRGLLKGPHYGATSALATSISVVVGTAKPKHVSLLSGPKPFPGGARATRARKGISKRDAVKGSERPVCSVCFGIAAQAGVRVHAYASVGGTGDRDAVIHGPHAKRSIAFLQRGGKNPTPPTRQMGTSTEVLVDYE